MVVEPFVTELAIRVDELALDEGAMEGAVGIALGDYNGGLAEGRLTRGDDPRLRTMELGVFASHSCTLQFFDSSVTTTALRCADTDMSGKAEQYLA
jgi:hypothetical protein